VQGLPWNNTLQGRASPIYDLNDMLYVRTHDFHLYFQLLLGISRGKLQEDEEYYNVGRNAY
jgi:hypothetical protein